MSDGADNSVEIRSFGKSEFGTESFGPDGFWTVDANRIILFYSRSEFCGLPAAKLLGAAIDSLRQIMSPESMARFTEALDEAFFEKRKIFDLQLTGVDLAGQNRYFIVHFIPTLDSGGHAASVQIITHDITENVRRRSELEDSRRRYQDIVEGSHEIIWECDQEGRWTFLNRAVTDILGYLPEELLGKHYFDLVTPEQSAITRKIFREQGQSNEFREFESCLFHKNGGRIWLSFNIRLIGDQSGEVIGRRGTARDISGQHGIAEFLKNYGTRLAKIIDRESICRTLIEAVSELIDNSAVSILLVDDAKVIVGPEQLPDDRYSFGEKGTEYNPADYPSLWRIFDTLQPWWVNNFDNLIDREAVELPPNLAGVKSVLVLPLPVFDHAVGILHIANFDNARRYGQYEIQLITGACSQAAAAIEWTKVYAEKMASERNYRELAENVNDIIFRTDYSGKIIYVTPSVGRILGYGQEEFITYFSNLLTEQQILEKFNWMISSVRDGASLAPFEIEIWHKVGRKMKFEINHAPIEGSDGEVVGVMGAMRNITSSSRLKEALDKIARKLSSLVGSENIPVEILKLLNEEFEFDSSSIYLRIGGEGNFVKTYNYTLRRDVEQVPLGAAINSSESPGLLDMFNKRDQWAIRKLGELTDEDDVFGYKHRFPDGSMFIAPLVHQDRIIGILTLTNYELTRNFPDYERRIFSSLAAQAGGALERIELIEKLIERVKELTALLSLVRNAEQFDSVENMLIGVCSDLLTGMKYHDLARSKIEFDGQVYYSEKFEPGPVRISAPVVVGGEGRGFVEIFYPDEQYKFLPEEQRLLEGVAEYVGQLIERIQLRSQVEREQKLATLGSFTRILAHEVRNPLNAMMLSLVLLERQLNKPHEVLITKTSESINIFRQELGRLDNLVNEYLLLGRGHMLNKKIFRVGDLIDETNKLLKDFFDNNAITLKLDVDYEVEIEADFDKFKQVIINLTKNGVEAMPHGGTVTIKACAAEGRAIISIIDEGIGISDVGKIFEPFFTTKSTGTGLGLPIVREIVEHHGGEFAVDSEPGKGTSISVSMPLFISKPEHEG